MSKQKALKQFPRYETDADAERFVDEADLSDYDFSEFKPMHFELVRKDARMNMRLPAPLLARIKTEAAALVVPYQRYMRDLMERGLAKGQKPQT